MSVSRRTLTRVAIVAPAAIVLGAFTASPALATGSRFLRSTWQPLQGRTFVLEGNGMRARAVLASVEDLTGARAGARERFALVFRAGHDLPEGTVSIRRPGFRAVELFVTRVDRGVVSQHCQAVINRI